MSMGDYRVADISLADFGRKEISLAEVEVSLRALGRSVDWGWMMDGWVD